MLYNEYAQEYDQKLVDRWKGDTDGILIFTGLFSTTVAAFIIESYKKLSVDSGDATVALLTQLVNQGTASSNGTQLPAPTPFQPFVPPTSAVRVNILWFLSFVMSLSCALAATLVQQWARHYLQMTQQRGPSPRQRARIRTYLFHGVQQSHIEDIVEFIPMPLHASVFLFFAGLVDFMVPINSSVGYTILAFVTVDAILYGLLTILPIAVRSSPYRTPLSKALWRPTHALILAVLR
ncbi:hypothetical protein FA95DRAFT_1499228, partial [Auriscalpium vulgare]